MQVDIRGKVKEKGLAKVHTMLPLFEAIVNSIHAIEEGSATKPGIIEVELIRSKQVEMDLDGQGKPPIISMEIRDNGIGFTKANFTSFDFAHSTYKEIKGGKGIGRFTWLRAFDKAQIESAYTEEDKWYKRTFSFELTKNGIENAKIEEFSIPLTRLTSVKLVDMKPDYQKWCNQDPEDIAFKIIEHCFPFFLNPNVPLIKLIDGDGSFYVNDRFISFTKGKVKKLPIKVRNEMFYVMFVKIYGGKLDNKIHYCADTREVENEKISSFIPELDNWLYDAAGDNYSIGVYVTGKYLDEKVSEDRTAINFDASLDAGEFGLPIEGILTKEELRKCVINVVEEQLKDVIDNLSEARIQRVETFIHQHRPRYRQLLKYKRTDIKKIPSGLSPDKLEIELFKIEQKLELEVKEETDQAIKDIEESTSAEDFQSKHPDLYSKIIDIGASKLSEYVLHRKVILDLFESHLKKSSGGKFAREDVIHSLIFPLKTTSDNIKYDEHNLWMIDERLAYHQYLASDIPLSSIKQLEAKSKERPDLLILNNSFAFNEDVKPYNSIVLVEFKRPMRDDYDDVENPITQINKYARLILEGQVQDKDGRSFDIRPGTQLYAYIICDLTPKLRTFARDASYTLLPDNDGYMFYNNSYNLYVEILSFDKLLNDARKRNKILFDKLGI